VYHSDGPRLANTAEPMQIKQRSCDLRTRRSLRVRPDTRQTEHGLHE